jgi:hypothetical protein
VALERRNKKHLFSYTRLDIVVSACDDLSCSNHFAPMRNATHDQS